MKTQTLVLVPIVFVAGILCVVVLQRLGVVSITQPGLAIPAALDGRTSDTGSSATQTNADNTVSNKTTNSVAGLSTQTQSQTSAQTGKLGAADTAPSNAVLNQRIDDLQSQFRAATTEADLMRSELSQLAVELETMSNGDEFLPQAGESGAQLSDVDLQATPPDTPVHRLSQSNADVQVNSLIAAGVDPNTAADIKQRGDQWALQRLELVDQATREGWRGSDEFDERLETLQEERPDIRSELGDDGYDRYLYAAGELNRVRVASVIDGSAAYLAGVLTGDVVLSYANERIFNMWELQRATSAGVRGETVSVSLLRTGERQSVDVPRGPLGVSLTGARLDPDTN